MGGIIELENINLSFQEGSFNSIIGASSNGKTTLLNIIIFQSHYLLPEFNVIENVLILHTVKRFL